MFGVVDCPFKAKSEAEEFFLVNLFYGTSGIIMMHLVHLFSGTSSIIMVHLISGTSGIIMVHLVYLFL